MYLQPGQFHRFKRRYLELRFPPRLPFLKLSHHAFKKFLVFPFGLVLPFRDPPFVLGAQIFGWGNTVAHVVGNIIEHDEAGSFGDKAMGLAQGED
ncbi:MAG: hypothetical protein WAT51_12035, partial [Holophaga sp.]